MRADGYDVVVVGGAFAGAATATLLRHWAPAARILIVERAETFDRKVGEATVEVSGFFLHHCLGLYDYLSREQLPKHGLRYWFADHPERRLEEMGETGPRSVPGLPSFQLDRAKLDEHLLAQAVAAGAELLRPAKVTGLEPGWPQARLRIAVEGREETIDTRWLVDASGRHAFLGRRLGLHSRVEEHPTAAIWARWQGVRDLDGVTAPAGGAPRLPPVAAARRLATNHFCGYGWWCWVIPLHDGATSVGVVWNKRLVEWPAGMTLRDRYQRFLAAQPGLREILRDARLDEDDFRSYSHLPYRTRRYADRGWIQVGDAAAFLDPYYSPGLDHASFSSWAGARLVADHLRGSLGEAELDGRISRHNEVFLRSYERWLAGLYVGKYEIMGDAELTSCAFLLDTSIYYLGVVSPVYRDANNLENPPMGIRHPGAAAGFWIVRFWNRRLVRLARFRRVLGTYGARNADWRLLVPPFGLGRGTLPLLARGVGIWLGAELSTLGDRIRGRRFRLPTATPVSALKETSSS